MKFENKIPISITIGGKDVNKIRINGEVVWQKEVEPVDANYLYVENTYNGSNTISVKQTITGSPDSSLYAKTLQYSKDKTNWSTITLSSTAYNINLNQGEKVYFRGNEGVLNYYANDGAIQAITNILGTQTHTIGGNINTLVNYITPNELTLTQSVFAGLFQNNTTITSAENLTLPPSLDGSLPTFAYYLMFSGCSALITPPSEIPATKQGHASCSKMFLDCTQLKTPPALKSTILGNYCFTSIFKNCTSLISAPELPALTLAQNCYQAAFEGCTSLVNPPALPATEMKPNCYRNLFYGCTSLVNPPELPATTLAEGCYRSLFNGCTSLTTAPDLLAPTLVSYCYAYLFNACTSLNSVKCTATSGVGSNNSTKEWLWNVSPTGTFTKESGVTWETGVSGIPSGWTVVNSNEPDYFYVENTYNGNNNIYVKTRAGYSGTEPTGEFATTLEYSKDKTNWTTINLDYDYYKNGSTVVSNLVTNLTLSLSVGEKVYFRNTSGYFGYVDSGIGTHSHQFSSDENIKTGGNIKSLLDYRDMVGTTMKKGCFYEMFFEAKKLTDASELILPDTVADSCYLKLFSGCSSLTSIPSLPALTMAPKCYCEMLKNTAITTPPELPSTKLAPYCYRNLFENCYSLTSSPELPATTMVEGCYQGLFNSCTHLTTSPVLSAKTLAKYSYRYMFNGCLRLNSVTSYADNINAEECTRWWLESVASSGTLHNLGSATYVTDSGDGIPTGWTEVKS